MHLGREAEGDWQSLSSPWLLLLCCLQKEAFPDTPFTYLSFWPPLCPHKLLGQPLKQPLTAVGMDGLSGYMSLPCVSKRSSSKGQRLQESSLPLNPQGLGHKNVEKEINERRLNNEQMRQQETGVPSQEVLEMPPQTYSCSWYLDRMGSVHLSPGPGLMSREYEPWISEEIIGPTALSLELWFSYPKQPLSSRQAEGPG